MFVFGQLFLDFPLNQSLIYMIGEHLKIVAIICNVELFNLIFSVADVIVAFSVD